MDDPNNIPNNPQAETVTNVIYGTGLALGFILFLIFILGFCTYIYKWRRRHPDATTDTSTDSRDTEKAAQDEAATVLDIPKLLYSQAKLQQHLDSAACSICLADYEETDVLRLLPECSHLFHLKCVDPWIRLKHTCPICWSPAMGTSLETPVAAEAATLRILTYDVM